MLHPWISRKPHYRYRDTFIKGRRGARGQDASLTQSGSGLANGTLQVNHSKPAIFRLPKEMITAEIFKLAQMFNHRDWRSARAVRYDGWCWITIAHVCSLWRDIAIGTQCLWVHVDIGELSGADQTATYLERSGGSELVVYYDHHEKPSLECLYLALANIHRIRELHILNVPAPYPDELRVALVHNLAPVLQKFTLHVDSTSQEAFDVSNLFKGVAPRLAELSLYLNCHSWAGHPAIKNLRELYLCDHLHSLALNEAFAILSENQNIEMFSVASLQNGVEQRHSALLSKSILLSRLKYIDIDANYDTLGRFLKGVVTPNLLGWDVRCTEYSILADPISAIPYIPKNKSITSLGLRILPSGIEISADRPEVPTEEWNEERPWRSLTYLWGETERPTISAKFLFMCYAITGGIWCAAQELMVQIQTVDIDNEDPLYTEDGPGNLNPWAILLNMLPALNALEVDVVSFTGGEEDAIIQDTHFGLLHALKTTCAEKDGSTRIICPLLKELHLRGVDVDVGITYLAEIITIRTLYGKRLRKLELSESLGWEEGALRVLKLFGVTCETVIR